MREEGGGGWWGGGVGGGGSGGFTKLRTPEGRIVSSICANEILLLKSVSNSMPGRTRRVRWFNNPNFECAILGKVSVAISIPSDD